MKTDHKINYVSAAEAVKLIKSGDHVYLQGSTSTPELLEQALADRGHELSNVTVITGFGVCRGDSPLCRPEYKDSFLVNSFFCQQRFPPLDQRGLWLDDTEIPRPSAAVDSRRLVAYGCGPVELLYA